MKGRSLQRFGAYVTDGEPISGGMGTVHSARHEHSGARVALKLPRGDGEDAAERIRQESALLARLSRGGHPGVPVLLDSGTHGGVPWYAMQFVDGITLRTFADDLWSIPPRASSSGSPGARRQRPEAANGQLERVRRVGSNVARVLSSIHSDGFVHCDCNPNNVIITPEGHAVLVDFGSATAAFSVDSRRELARGLAGSHGTVGYVAPEQLLGHSVDSRCDLYALGCILYELCTGRTPFAAGDARSLVARHLYDEPAPPGSLVHGLPASLEQLILGLLEKDPRARPAFAADVVHQLSREDGDKERPSGRPAGAMFLHRSSLVGRDDIIERLLDAARDAAAGRGGWVVVSGESGIGKTRLVAELGQRLAGQPLRAFYGSCSARTIEGLPVAASSPLEPFRAFLRGSLDRAMAPSVEWLERIGPHLAVLAAYEPELLAHPNIAAIEVPSLPGALGRKRVLRALRECLVDLARVAPVLLVLDDLHAADELTLEFLASEHMLELRSEPVLFIGTRRVEQVDDELAAIIAANARADVTLPRLAAPEVRLLVKEMLAEDFPPNAFVDYLHQQSEGNPFFVAEYLRVALETGAISRAASSKWSFPEVNAGSRPYANLSTPDSLMALAELRLSSVAERDRGHLQVAALLGRDFDPELLEQILERVTGQQRASARATLHEFVRLQLLAVHSHGHYRFAHDKLREAVARGIEPAAAAALHRAVAEQLEERPHDGSAHGGLDADIGLHWAFAGQPARAVERLKIAARRADEIHAHQQAIDLYALAIEQSLAAAASPAPTDGAAPIDGTDAIHLSEQLADLLTRTAKHERARRQYAFSIERAPQSRGLTLARLWRKYAETHIKVHEHKQALQALARAEAFLEERPAEHDADVERAQEWIALQQARLTIHYFSDPHGAETERLVKLMLPAVERHGSPDQKSYFFQCVANERAGRQRYRFSGDIITLERSALAELESVKPAPVLQLGLARFDLAFMLLLGGRAECEEALPLLLEALACAEQFEDMTLLARSLTYLSIACRRLGDRERTVQYSTRARQVAEVAEIKPYLGAAAANLGWNAWLEDREDDALTFVREARSWWSRAEHVFPFQWLANWVLLDVQSNSDDFEAAEATLDDLLGPMQQTMPLRLEEALLAAKARCAARDPMPAERALRGALDLAREGLYV